MNQLLKFKQEAIYMDCCLNELGTFYGGLSGKTKEHFGTGDAKFVTYMNVFSNCIARKDQCECVLISDDEKQNLVKKGDILFTQSSETPEEVGMASIWTHDLDVYLNSFCFGFRVLDPKKTNPLYLTYLLRSPKYRQAISIEAQGISRYNLSSSRLSSLKLRLHSCEEQQKIAEFFTALDEKIQFLGKKLKLTHSLKHSMMDKVFTQKVRFKSDTSEPFKDWMALELGSFCSFYAGQTPKSTCSDYYGGEINWVASGDLNRGVIFNTEKTITNAGLNSANLKIIPKGSFVIALFGLEAENVCGNCGLLGIDAAINQACLNIKPNEEILLTKYLFYYYQHFGKSFCKSNAQGTKQQNLNIELISQFAIKIPCIEEQRKICAFFDQIEKSILLLDRKLCCLKELKKAFMQRMFV